MSQVRNVCILHFILQNCCRWISHSLFHKQLSLYEVIVHWYNTNILREVHRNHNHIFVFYVWSDMFSLPIYFLCLQSPGTMYTDVTAGWLHLLPSWCPTAIPPRITPLHGIPNPPKSGQFCGEGSGVNLMTFRKKLRLYRRRRRRRPVLLARRLLRGRLDWVTNGTNFGNCVQIQTVRITFPFQLTEWKADDPYGKTL